MTISISIIIPSFNQGRFLTQALESVLDQNWPATEIIVVDGGSTDESVDVLERNSRHLTWWVSDPDRGQAHAINKGFERCAGDLVTFMGADDVYLPLAFGDAARLFKENPDCGAVVGGFLRIDSQSRVTSGQVAALYSWPGPTDLMVADPGSWRLHQVSTFYSRKALDAVGHFVKEDLQFVMDRELLNRVCRRYRVVTSPRVYGAFRHHGSSKSTSEILPFSRELAELHFREAPVDEGRRLQRKRRQLARRQIGSGYLKVARATGAGWSSIKALAAVPFVSPHLVLTRTFAVRLAEALGIASPIRRLIGRGEQAERRRPLSEVVREL